VSASPPRPDGAAAARRPAARARLGTIVGFLLALAAGAALATLTLGPLTELEPRGAQKWALILALFPVLILGLAAHEAGHALAGALSGFRLYLFVVGPLKLQRVGDRLRAGLNRNVGLYGGAVVSAPPAEVAALRERFLRVVAGGPLASLALGLLALGASRALPVPRPGAGTAELVAYASLLVFATLSLGLALVTLTPNSLGGLPSDGARLLQLRRGGPEAERDVAALALTSLSMAGRRPREWPAALTEQAAAGPDVGFYAPLGHLMAYQRALDAGEEARAGEELRRALAVREQLPAPYRPVLLLEGAYYEAAHRRNAAAARSWLEGAARSPAVEAHVRLRAEAAVLAAEGDLEGARRAAAQARASLEATLNPGSAALYRDLLDRLERPER
jgi:hypothetical protein